jgi:hypothetical protein
VEKDAKKCNGIFGDFVLLWYNSVRRVLSVCVVWEEYMTKRMRGKSVKLLFWEMVSVRDKKECWVWMGSKLPSGYGRYTTKDKDGTKMKTWYAHRYSYYLEHGEIPDGMCVCHSCDNPSCVNPFHLWLGTMQDNVNDMMAKGRGIGGRYDAIEKSLSDDVLERFANGEKRKDIALSVGIPIRRVGTIIKRHYPKYYYN